MPPPIVKTIRDLIYWEYANLITKSASFEKNYGFMISRFDHIIPRNRGGPDITSNLVLACKSCNSSKGDKTSSTGMASKEWKRFPNSS